MLAAVRAIHALARRLSSMARREELRHLIAALNASHNAERRAGLASIARRAAQKVAALPGNLTPAERAAAIARLRLEEAAEIERFSLHHAQSGQMFRRLAVAGLKARHRADSRRRAHQRVGERTWLAVRLRPFLTPARRPLRIRFAPLRPFAARLYLRRRGKPPARPRGPH